MSSAEATGRPLEEVIRIVDATTRESAPNPMALAMREDKAVGLTPNCVLIRRDNLEAAIEDSVAPIRDRRGTVIGAVMVFHDVSVAPAKTLKMSYLAQHDRLTDLPNAIGRVEDWRADFRLRWVMHRFRGDPQSNGHHHVSSSCRIERSVRVSRTTVTCSLRAMVYGTYATEMTCHLPGRQALRAHDRLQLFAILQAHIQFFRRSCGISSPRAPVSKDALWTALKASSYV
jgi:hypothetical protein